MEKYIKFGENEYLDASLGIESFLEHRYKNPGHAGEMMGNMLKDALYSANYDENMIFKFMKSFNKVDKY